MAFLKSKSLRYLSISLISFIIILLVSLFIVIRIYIPSQIKNVLRNFANENDITITVEDVSYNPFLGVTGEKLKLGRLPESGVSNLEISNITVQPELLRSYLSGRLLINYIEINGARLSLNEDLFSIFKHGQDKDGDDIEKDDKKQYEIGEIKLNEFAVSYKGKYNFYLQKVHISKKDISRDITTGEFEGDVGDSADFRGEFEFNNVNKTTTLDAVILNTGPATYKDLFRVPRSVTASVKTDITLDDTPSFKGKITVSESNTGQTRGNIAGMTLLGSYDEGSDEIKIGKLDITGEIISLFSKGTISDLTESPSLSLNGRLGFYNLEEAAKWIIPLERAGVSGSLYAQDIILDISPSKSEVDMESHLFSDSIKLGGYRLNNLNTQSLLTVREDRIRLGIEDLESEFLGGYLSGSAGYTGGEAGNRINSVLTLEDIKLEALSEIYNIPLKGGAVRLSARIEGDFNSVSSDVSVNSGQIIYGNSESPIIMSDINTVSPVHLTLENYLNDRTTFILDGKNLSAGRTGLSGASSGHTTLQKLRVSHDEESGTVAHLEISGEDLEYKGAIKLSEFHSKLAVKDSDGLMFKGEFAGRNGVIADRKINEIHSSYDYSGNTVLLTDSRISSELTGVIGFDSIDVNIPESRSGQFVINAERGTVANQDLGISAQGIECSFRINRQQDDSLKGEITSSDIKIMGLELNDTAMGLEYFNDRMKISYLKGKIFDGTLHGTGTIRRSDSGTDFSFSTELRKISPLSSNDLFEIGKISLNAGGTLGKSNGINGNGKIAIENLGIRNNNRKTELNGNADIRLENEAIFFENALIYNKDINPVVITGEINNLFSNNRGSSFNIQEIPLSSISRIISPLLPDEIARGEFSGDLSLYIDTYNLFEKLSNWRGILHIRNAGFAGSLSKTDFRINGIDGLITFKDKTEFINRLKNIIGNELELTREIYNRYLEAFRDYGADDRRDYLRVRSVTYGFLKAENIETVFEVDKEKMNLLHLKAEMYGGHLYGTGVLRFGGNENYDVSLLLEDLSLATLTSSIPSMQNYITGIVYGLLWFSAGESYWTINGPFSFWAKDSEDEKRTIGRALLEKLGAKSRFFTRSSRRYDKGIVSGYIKDGIMTFRDFEISNSILGYQDLLIQADPRMNSISVKHLLSVIRELARRAGKGGIQIDYENTKD